MIGAADSDIQPDHIVGQGDHGIDARRARVIGMMRPDPADPVAARPPDGLVGAEFHHQMAEPVVAVDQRHRAAFARDADTGPRVVAAGAQALQITRQAKDAVTVAAQKIGLDHHVGDGGRVGLRQPLGGQHPGDKALQPRGGNPQRHARPRPAILVRSSARSVCFMTLPFPARV